jgi:hypothetical protein
VRTHSATVNSSVFFIDPLLVFSEENLSRQPVLQFLVVIGHHGPPASQDSFALGFLGKCVQVWALMFISARVNMGERVWMKGATAGRVPLDMSLFGISVSVLTPGEPQRLFYHSFTHSLQSNFVSRTLHPR